jgi:hypothetical protein
MVWSCNCNFVLPVEIFYISTNSSYIENDRYQVFWHVAGTRLF